MNIIEHLADIQRRIRALKANRPVHIAQVEMLEVSQSFNITLASTYMAQIEVTISCAGTPLCDVSFAGFANVGSGIIPANVMWNISGNTAIATCQFINNTATADTRTIALTAWAINGLSASFERII